MKMNKKLTAAAMAAITALSLPTYAFSWDPWGDITHPERIVNNIKREGQKVIDTAKVGTAALACGLAAVETGPAGVVLAAGACAKAVE